MEQALRNIVEALAEYDVPFDTRIKLNIKKPLTLAPFHIKSDLLF